MEGKCVTGGRLDAGKALAMAAEYAGEKINTNRQLANDPVKESKEKEGKIIYRLAN
jgi:hypothetical protein